MPLKANLYEHQTEGAEFLINKRRALLSHDQGLGKTATSLGAFEKLKELGKAEKCLIIAEASYLWQWEREIKKFTTSSYTRVTRTSVSARENYNHETDYTLISYDIYLRDFLKICLSEWDVIITDEAQRFANNKSKTAQYLKKYNVKHDPVYRWALTGTAIRSKLEHLYSIMYWVDKSFLPLWPVFEKRHIERIQIGITGYKNLIPLHKHLKHRMHRKTYKDVEGKIPKVIGPVIHVLESTEKYEKAQEDLLNTLDTLKEDIELNDFIPFKSKSQAAKAFNNCKKLLSGKEKVDYLIPEIQKVLDEDKNNKIVVFSFYKEPLYLLDKSLKRKKIKSVRFTGDETDKGKQASIQSFATDHRVLLCSNAGSRGLDLPYANYVYHVDIPFSFDTLDQRNKRVTRLSSVHRSVVINYLITDRSIEKYYFDITLKQGDLAVAVFDEPKDKVKVKTQTLRQFLDAYRRENKRVPQLKESD